MKLCRFDGGRPGMVYPERNALVDVSVVLDRIAPQRYPRPRHGQEIALDGAAFDSPVANPWDRLDVWIEKIGGGTVHIAPQYANAAHALD
jgi:hypothetical protein